MDADRFDALTRRLPNRLRLSVLGASLPFLGILSGVGTAAVAAKNKKKKKCKKKCSECQKCKKGKCKPKPNGTACGTGRTCANGTCIYLCAAGGRCVPDGSDPCCPQTCACFQDECTCRSFPCKSFGDECSEPSDCCQGTCGCVGGHCTCRVPVCSETGEECTATFQCCGGLCGECSIAGCVCSDSGCRDVGDTCEDDADCCSGQCGFVGSSSLGTCRNEACSGDNHACGADSDCCTGSCGCVDVGKACAGKDGNCCSNICQGKKPKKGKKDKSRCVAHHIGNCTPARNVCQTEDLEVSDCNVQLDDVFCTQTTGKAGFCADFSVATCLPCTKDGDCNSSHTACVDLSGSGENCSLLLAVCSPGGSNGSAFCIPTGDPAFYL
jgi:hypothetical protein